jgi:hypothetical protein
MAKKPENQGFFDPFLGFFSLVRFVGVFFEVPRKPGFRIGG